ncbi:MAG: hypothetical protein ACIAXF_09160 [Phycisphaerales bacterium JB063]
MKRRLTTALALSFCAGGASLLSASASAQAIQGRETSEADGAAIQNERALEHMREMEDRMATLARLLKETQPDDALRLEMTFEQSRGARVTQRMAEVGDLIASLELTEASANVDAIIDELEKIKRMLLTQDLGLLEELVKLEKINDALEALEEIERREAENQEQTDMLASEASPNAQAMQGLSGAEARNSEATEGLESEVGEIDPQNAELNAAQEALDSAAQNMESAAGQLGQPGGSPSSASGSQSQAREDLQEAREQLEAARDAIQEKIERKVREVVVENLQAMLDQQIAIRTLLESVSGPAESGDARAIVAVRGLAPEEDKIVQLAEETIELAEQTDFSLALPPALSAVRDRMQYLVDDYTAGLGGASVVAATIQVEDDLRSLIEAMEQSNANQPPQDPQQQQSGEQQQQQEMNQILAELRMLKLLQIANNDNTVRLEEARQRGNLPDTEIRRRQLGLRDRQEQIRDTTRALGERAANGG